jgi:hypothetical protein
MATPWHLGKSTVSYALVCDTSQFLGAAAALITGTLWQSAMRAYPPNKGLPCLVRRSGPYCAAGASLRTRYTLARPIPNRAAIWDAPSFSSSFRAAHLVAREVASCHRCFATPCHLSTVGSELS